MKLYESGFIGHQDSNWESEWFGGDCHEGYIKTCESNPDWYYKDKPFTYKLNSLGHRSKDISEINLDDYILVTGCSHTEGIGLAVENTYPYLLAKHYNCDYYNLALGSTGIDVVLHNLIIWFTRIKKLPRLVVIQWPDQVRTISGTSNDNLTPRGLWEESEEFNRFVHYGFETNFFECRKLLANAIVKSLIPVTTVYFGVQKVIPFDDNTVIEPIIDHARDNGHAGINSHIKFAQSIIDSL